MTKIGDEASEFPYWLKLKALQEKLGYEFQSAGQLCLALTHTSWANEHGAGQAHNQRLEFLGDAVFELCVSEELFRRFPAAREGAMTELRSKLVSETALANIARLVGLDQTIRLGKGEERQAGRMKDSLLADALEAVMGAIYLDGGLDAAKKVICGIYANLWPEKIETTKKKDPKSQLQETCQKHFRNVPVYTVIGASGPEHERIFDVKLTLPDGREFFGQDSSAKKAEQAAAASALADF